MPTISNRPAFFNVHQFFAITTALSFGAKKPYTAGLFTPFVDNKPLPLMLVGYRGRYLPGGGYGKTTKTVHYGA